MCNIEESKAEEDIEVQQETVEKKEDEKLEAVDEIVVQKEMKVKMDIVVQRDKC